MSAAADPVALSSTSPVRTPAVMDDTRKSPMKLAPATIRRLVSDATADTEHGVERGEQRDGDRHLPQHVGVVAACSRAHCRSRAPGRRTAPPGAGTRTRTGSRRARRPSRSRSRHPSTGGRRAAAAPAGAGRDSRMSGAVMATKTSSALETPTYSRYVMIWTRSTDLVASDVRDADVDDGGHGDDGEQRERRDLLAPRPANAERAPDRRAVQRERRGAPPAARPVVRAVAAVVDRAGHGADDGAGRRRGVIGAPRVAGTPRRAR